MKLDETNNNRVKQIDSLKGIAICGVVMIHSGALQMPSLLGKIGNIGKNGVQLFFILSAYLLYCSLEKLSKTNGGNLSFALVKKWWICKFLKLIPLYYIAIVLYWLMGGKAYWLGSEGHVTLLNVLSHMLFIHGFFPHYINSIIGVEWYLADLAIFYLLVPFIYKYINSFEKAFMGIVLTMFSYSLIERFVCLDMPMRDAYIYDNYIGVFWLPRQIPIFLCGVMLYFLLRDNTVKDRIRNKKMLAYTILALSGIMIAGEMYGKNTLFGVKDEVRFSFWFMGLIISQMLYPDKLINNRIFQVLGKSSYPIYLFHIFLLDLYNKIAAVSTGNVVGDWGIKFIIVLGGSYIVSVALIKWVDRPIQEIMLKKCRKYLRL